MKIKFLEFIENILIIILKFKRIYGHKFDFHGFI